MKKLILLALVLMLFSGSALCYTLTGKRNSIGLDFPALGWLNPNMINNEPAPTISDLGINLGLGVSYKRFFNPVKTNQFNPYFAAGTIAIIIPYLGIGADYVWNNGLYLGGGFIWVIPEIHGGFMF